jgi:hypothetical protein
MSCKAMWAIAHVTAACIQRCHTAGEQQYMRCMQCTSRTALQHSQMFTVRTAGKQCSLHALPLAGLSTYMLAALQRM